MPTLESVHAGARSITHRIGYRGAVLLVFALIDIIYAFSFAFPTQEALKSQTFQYLVNFLPLPVWVIIWGGVGSLCIFFAFRRNDAWGYASAIMIKIFWAWIFLIGWALNEVGRGYLSAVIWGGFAVFLWLESRRPENPTKELTEEVTP